MSEWGIALIAAGSAIACSIKTGWFAWKAGHRQAAAAEAAGHAQANALITTVQATLDEQRRARAAEWRRQVYLELLDAAQCCQVEATTEAGSRLLRAESMVELVGPAPIASAADAYMQLVLVQNPSDQEKDDAEWARRAYIEAVHQALNET
ncbi:hypothetical protein AB0C77_12360 [Streptomyces sp. NPDC048629]|uniref:hypothetical protein n=1 Tax=Streptomyces sp. NPDC048629 TaxID=3154824 RepID=UPI0034375A3F